MKILLAKSETKATFGTGENSFNYYYRPLTVEEKQGVNSRIVYTQVDGKPEIDYAKTNLSELLRMAVTKIEGLTDSSGKYEIDTIDKLLTSTPEAGQIDGISIVMWTEIYVSMNLPEELKKKLSQGFTLTDSDTQATDQKSTSSPASAEA